MGYNYDKIIEFLNSEINRLTEELLKTKAELEDKKEFIRKIKEIK